jgi:hypothetical protein
MKTKPDEAVDLKHNSFGLNITEFSVAFGKIWLE